jgi:hypothetical protein
MSKRLGHGSNSVSAVYQDASPSHVDMDYGKNP